MVVAVAVGDGVGVGEGLGVAVGTGLGVPVGAGRGVPVGPGLDVAAGPAFGVPVGPGLGVAVTWGAGLTVGVLVAFPPNTCGCVAKKAPARTTTMMRARMAGSSHRGVEFRSGGGGVVGVVAIVVPSCRIYAASGYWSSKLNA